MSLLSGLNYQQLTNLKPQGFELAVVVQHGADHYQAWLRHGRKLDKERGERVAKHLAQRAGGDLTSRRLGQLWLFGQFRRAGLGKWSGA